MSDQISGTEPILCAPLLRRIETKLIDLLCDLRSEEWDLQTIAPAWKVRDVVAHLVDTPFRKLSIVRDGWFVENPQIQSPQGLIDFINRLNREGVAVYRRLSPAVLIGLIEFTRDQYADFHESLDPFATAAFNVSWAGESTSLNWFDTARELTERWHHQQQIRYATHRSGIMTPDLYHPVLDCFIRGLPHAYRDVNAPSGTSIELSIAGECGGRWILARSGSSWSFSRIQSPQAAACVVIPQEIAWRVFTKGISRAEAIGQSSLDGDLTLAERVFDLTSIVG